jgi:uncharacterized membrane protein
MGLSPEERQKIYEEEKARIEAEEKLKREKQRAEAVSTLNLEPNIAGLLCYVAGWITGVIFLLLEQKNKFVRFHAIQSIIVFGILNLAINILSHIPVIGGFFGVIIGVFGFILWIVLMVKAYHHQLYKVPLAGDLAEKLSTVSGGKDEEGIGIREEDKSAKPPRPPQPPSTATGDYFKTTRGGRITSSSFAIAWSFALLIFFNFFNQYIAYYQLEKIDDITKWVRYPILTGDFNLWLPFLTTALVLSIIGHIILIIFDKYLLRETTLIVLNLFGIAVVSALLSIFPFDFSLIPNTTVANSLPAIATIVLICIAVGLGIASLVRFIRLIVNVATRTASY